MSKDRNAGIKEFIVNLKAAIGQDVRIILVRDMKTKKKGSCFDNKDNKNVYIVVKCLKTMPLISWFKDNHMNNIHSLGSCVDNAQGYVVSKTSVFPILFVMKVFHLRHLLTTVFECSVCLDDFDEKKWRLSSCPSCSNMMCFACVCDMLMEKLTSFDLLMINCVQCRRPCYEVDEIAEIIGKQSMLELIEKTNIRAKNVQSKVFMFNLYMYFIIELLSRDKISEEKMKDLGEKLCEISKTHGVPFFLDHPENESPIKENSRINARFEEVMHALKQLKI